MVRKKVTIYLLFMALLASCGEEKSTEDVSSPQSIVSSKSSSESDPLKSKGVGPVDKVILESVDQEMAKEGKSIYEQYCTACHKPTEKFIGPAPQGILDRRSPEWVMNMILNPEEMVKKDPVAKNLLVEYNMAPMANQGLTHDQARKILEYFRTL